MLEEEEEEKYRKSSWNLTLGFPHAKRGSAAICWAEFALFLQIEFGNYNFQIVVGTSVKRDG